MTTKDITIQDIFKHYFTDVDNKYLLEVRMIDNLLEIEITLNGKPILSKRGIVFHDYINKILDTDKGFGIDYSNLNRKSITYYDIDNRIELRMV